MEHDEADFTAAEIADAQEMLDTQPSFSPYWDSHHAQDVMEIIDVCKLVATTTETERRQMHNDAMRAARAEVYS